MATLAGNVADRGGDVITSWRGKQDHANAAQSWTRLPAPGRCHDQLTALRCCCSWLFFSKPNTALCDPALLALHSSSFETLTALFPNTDEEPVLVFSQLYQQLVAKPWATTLLLEWSPRQQTFISYGDKLIFHLVS